MPALTAPAHWSDQLDDRLGRIGWPDLGDSSVWLWWFARSLSLLEDRGWFALIGPPENTPPERAPSEGPRGELFGTAETIFALRWLAEDFVATGDPFADTEPYWNEWCDVLGIPLTGVREAARRLPGWEAVAEDVKDTLECSDDPADYEDHAEYEEHYLAEREQALAIQSLLLIVVRKRQTITRMLIDAWGGPTRFYEALYATCHSSYLYDHFSEADFDEDETEPATKSDVTAFEQLLEKCYARQVNELAGLALATSLNDGGFEERAEVFGWVLEDCPVRVTGCPAFLG